MKIYFLFDYADYDASGGFSDLIDSSDELDTLLHHTLYTLQNAEIWVLDTTTDFIPTILCRWAGKVQYKNTAYEVVEHPFGWYIPNTWAKFVTESEKS